MINRAIHPKDQMFTGNWERYESVGRDAMSKIRSILSLSASSVPNDILDLACGHGRVARHLRAAYPSARIVGSDLMTHAVDFCAREFAYIPHNSRANLDEVHFSQPFDLIWSGSLMTHIGELDAKKMLSLIVRSLAPNGIAIWTTHGRHVETVFERGKWFYKVSSEQFSDIVRSFREGNYGYSDYEGKKGYGISMMPLSWLMSEIRCYSDVRVISLIERGWDEHQDIIAIAKRPIR